MTEQQEQAHKQAMISVLLSRVTTTITMQTYVHSQGQDIVVYEDSSTIEETKLSIKVINTHTAIEEK